MGENLNTMQKNECNVAFLSGLYGEQGCELKGTPNTVQKIWMRHPFVLHSMQTMDANWRKSAYRAENCLDYFGNLSNKVLK